MLCQPGSQIFILFDLLGKRNLDAALALFQLFYFGEGSLETHISLCVVGIIGRLYDPRKSEDVRLLGGTYWDSAGTPVAPNALMLVITRD